MASLIRKVDVVKILNLFIQNIELELVLWGLPSDFEVK